MTNPFGGADGHEGTDALWVIISAFIIFTMQSGFGLLESGLVSRKSEANVIIKNMLDVTLGGIAYWFVGYGFSFGPNLKESKSFSGEGNFMTRPNIDTDENAHIYAFYFFQLSFATTATTIVSGAVAERVKLSSYMIFAIVNTGLIYVFPAHWIWSSDGWLFKKGVVDFAGSSVVHMSGGAAAFSACLLLGPRHERFGAVKRKFGMASPTNVVLGTFFLWWGWIGFNCGSTLAITGGAWRIVSRVAVVTMNGAMAGGASAVLLDLALWRRRRYILDITDFCSGILGGLVAVTAPAATIQAWEAIIIGFIGGLVANGVIALLNKVRIDDPVGCVGVHWASGLWAMIATGLFAEDVGVLRGGDGTMLGYNIAAALCVTLWSGGLSAVVFAIMKYTIGVRLELEEELLGSDEVEHNIKEDPVGAMIEKNHSLGKHVVQRGPVNSPPKEGTVELKAYENGANGNGFY